mmetsp:Transcript_30908/g.89792  ORF Transcript_30908/g.89792 Transcript_30908/m.89792 type:complete len:282 (+) Transcript_30908:622-1467(+)
MVLGHVIDHRKAHGTRNRVFAHALDLERHGFDDVAIHIELPEDRTHGVGTDHRDTTGLGVLEVTSCAGNRAPGRRSSEEMGDLAIGLLHDLRTQAQSVRLRVQKVVVLVHPEVVGILLTKPELDVLVVVRVICRHARWTHDEFSAVTLECIHLLLGALFVGDDLGCVAPSPGQQGHSSARVATARRHHGASRRQVPRFLSRVDDVKSDAVLDGAPRVLVLHLQEDLDQRVRGQPLHLHETRVSNVLRVVGSHHVLDGWSVRFRSRDSPLSCSREVPVLHPC